MTTPSNAQSLFPSPSGEELLEVRGLKKHFPAGRDLFLSHGKRLVRAVDNISFDIRERETFSLVGESGCGKTTTAKLILRLEEPTSGQIIWRGQDVRSLTGSGKRQYACAVQAVFQDPYSSLNPRMKIGSAVAEPLVVRRELTNKQIAERVAQLLTQAGLSPEAAEHYPHEFSGGQRQRIAIAQALAVNPKLIVLDEPVSALDASIRAQIMNLLKDLQDALGTGYLLIAHDLATVRYMSHRIGVMYLGKLVELGVTESLFRSPLHPYTRALIAASLPIRPRDTVSEIQVTGEAGSPLSPPSGCRFHPRCLEALPVCSTVEPRLVSASAEHRVACHLYQT